MRRMLVVAALVTLGACGPASTATDTVASSAPGEPTAAASAATGVVEGVLEGDPRLEGGCVWLETDGGRVEVLWPDGYRATAEPVELRDPTGAVVASGGDRVRVRGLQATDRVTVCQVGRIWAAREVTPIP